MSDKNPLAVPRVEKKWPMAFDMHLNRPGGPQIQVKHGASVWVANKFPNRLWLTSDSPNIQVYHLSMNEIDMFVKSAIIADTLKWEGRFTTTALFHPAPR